MSLRLPSRYEDLDIEYRGRLRPDKRLIDTIKQAFKSMEISGGIRFLPIYGRSGSGKTSSTLEIGTHLPQIKVIKLSRGSISDQSILLDEIDKFCRLNEAEKVVAVIDQYEEVAAERAAIPKSFVEYLSLLDRDRSRKDMVLFIWLTTSKDFQNSLQEATSRNRRILTSQSFEISGPLHSEWPSIITETFQVHNQDRNLSDYEIIEDDLEMISKSSDTIGQSIELVGERLSKHIQSLHDISDYQVVMLWPVTDGLRITRIHQYTDPRQGYKLDWGSWYRGLNQDDQRQLPLRELNRARLYFDMRLVPVAAADLHQLCKELDNDRFKLHKTYLERLRNTHFFSIVSGSWNPESYSPLRERESSRADNAREWYESVTRNPIGIGKRIARCLKELSLSADYEQEIRSEYSKIRADILLDRTPTSPPKVIIEIKAYSPENTMPSTICSAVQTTLRRHAQFAGFLKR